jgi:hypothetical protein
MKTLLLILALLMAAPSAQAFDHKKCVIDYVKNFLSSTNSCEADRLKSSIGQVQNAYADCDRDMVITTNDVSLDELKEISAADYDHELRDLIRNKATSCVYKASVQLSSKGLIGSVNIVKSVGEKKAIVADEAHHE